MLVSAPLRPSTVAYSIRSRHSHRFGYGLCSFSTRGRRAPPWFTRAAQRYWSSVCMKNTPAVLMCIGNSPVSNEVVEVVDVTSTRCLSKQTGSWEDSCALGIFWDDSCASGKSSMKVGGADAVEASNELRSLSDTERRSGSSLVSWSILTGTLNLLCVRPRPVQSSPSILPQMRSSFKLLIMANKARARGIYIQVVGVMRD